MARQLSSMLQAWRRSAGRLTVQSAVNVLPDQRAGGNTTTTDEVESTPSRPFKAEAECWNARQGAAAPLHVHSAEDEQFLIVDGQGRLIGGGERIDGGAGDLIFLPRAIPHSYVITSGTARLVGMSPQGVLRPSSPNSARQSGPARARAGLWLRWRPVLRATVSRSSARRRRSMSELGDATRDK